MTIAYVLDDTLDKSDGVQQAMITIAEKMRKLGHDVHYIVPFTERKDLQNVHCVAKVIAMRFNGNSIRTPIWSSGKKIKKLFTEYNFDVIHVQMPYSPVMSSKVIMNAPKNTKIIGTFHILPYNFVASTGTRLIGVFMRRSLRRFDKLYAVSSPALEFMRKSFRVEGSVLPNPINYDFFHSFSEANTQNKNSKKRMVFVGRFEERKGVVELIEAFNIMKNRDKTELIMCGKGPLWERINSYNTQHNLGVNLAGFVSEEEKARYLASADIAVFPSISGESFGMVLTEAMSAGSGVTLGGNNPGYASVLCDWPETLFNPKDVNNFAKLLDSWIMDNDRRRQIGEKQHSAVVQYNIEVISEKLVSEAYM